MEYIKPISATATDFEAGSMIILMGVPGSGKSTWAKANFKPTEIVSSDTIRAMLTDDEGNQECSSLVFDILHKVANYRMKAGKTAVIDATNLSHKYRRPFIDMAKFWDRKVYVVFFQVSMDQAVYLDASRPRTVGPEVIAKFMDRVENSLTVLHDTWGTAIGVDGVYIVDPSWKEGHSPYGHSLKEAQLERRHKC